MKNGAGTQRLGVLVGISGMWLGLSLLFDGLNTLVLPRHLDNVLGDQNRATALGLIAFAGLLAGMLVQPVAGAASDRRRARWGRRGPLAVGVVGTLVALALFGASRSTVTVLLSFVAVHVAAAVAQSAQQGFIPDLVPTGRRGVAAGCKGFMDVAGAMVGFVVLGQLLSGGAVGGALVFIAVILVATLMLTFLLVREPRPASSDDAGDPRRAGVLDVRADPAFVRLVGARFFFLLGTFGVGRFFLFFVEDRLGLSGGDAAARSGALLGGLALITVLAAVPAGAAADRFGRRPLMHLGAAASGVGVVGLIFAHSAMAILVAGAAMAVGSAAFSSANWAMTADVTPTGEGGRYFGVAKFGTAGAAAAAGLFGILVDAGDRLVDGGGYVGLFFACAVAFAISSTFAARIPEARGTHGVGTELVAPTS